MLLNDHHVLVLWIRDQQSNFSGVKANAVAAFSVLILEIDLSKDAGDIFLLRDALGVTFQTRVIEFAILTNLNLLCGAGTWMADATIYLLSWI